MLYDTPANRTAVAARGLDTFGKNSSTNAAILQAQKQTQTTVLVQSHVLHFLARVACCRMSCMTGRCGGVGHAVA